MSQVGLKTWCIKKAWSRNNKGIKTKTVSLMIILCKVSRRQWWWIIKLKWLHRRFKCLMRPNLHSLPQVVHHLRTMTMAVHLMNFSNVRLTKSKNWALKTNKRLTACTIIWSRNRERQLKNRLIGPAISMPLKADLELVVKEEEVGVDQVAVTSIEIGLTNTSSRKTKRLNMQRMRKTTRKKLRRHSSPRYARRA